MQDNVNIGVNGGVTAGLFSSMLFTSNQKNGNDLSVDFATEAQLDFTATIK